MCRKFSQIKALKASFELLTLTSPSRRVTIKCFNALRLHLQVISYDSQRGGVSVITEKGDITTSYLLIQNADLADSGRYSCAPSNADVAGVRVHVLNGNLHFFLCFKMEKSSRIRFGLREFLCFKSYFNPSVGRRKSLSSFLSITR